MKWYIAKCYYSGNRVVELRTQACDTVGLEPIAAAIAYGFTGRMPVKVKFDLCPIQMGATT